MNAVSSAMATITLGRAAMSWVRQPMIPSGVPLASQMFAVTPAFCSWACATAAHSCSAGISSVRLIRSAVLPLAAAMFTGAVGPCQVGGCSICATACLASVTPDEAAAVDAGEDAAAEEELVAPVVAVPELELGEDEHAARTRADTARPAASPALRLTPADLLPMPSRIFAGCMTTPYICVDVDPGPEGLTVSYGVR